MIDRLQAKRLVFAASAAALLFLGLAVGPRLHAAAAPDVTVKQNGRPAPTVAAQMRIDGWTATRFRCFRQPRPARSSGAS